MIVDANPTKEFFIFMLTKDIPVPEGDIKKYSGIYRYFPNFAEFDA